MSGRDPPNHRRPAGPLGPGHDEVLRAARTMADLDGSGAVRPRHIAEAVASRSLDRGVWA